MNKMMTFICIGLTAYLQADPVCSKCQRIREYNVAHPENNYEWYEDYLKDHPEEAAKLKNMNEDPEENKKN